MKWYNKIANRLTILSGAVFLFFFFMNSVIYFFEYKSELKQLQKSHSQIAQRFFVNFVNNEFEILSEFVENYSSDDSLYQLVNNYQTQIKFASLSSEWPQSTALLTAQSQQYVKQKLAPSLLSDHNFSTVFVQDNDGAMINSVSRLGNKAKARLVSLMSTAKDLNYKNEKGFVIVGKNIFFYVKKNIIDTHKKYPQNGYLTIFSLFNGKNIDRISQNMNKTLFLIEDEAIKNDRRYNLDDGLITQLNKQLTTKKNSSDYDSFNYDLLADNNLLLPFKIRIVLPEHHYKKNELYYAIVLQFLLFIFYTLLMMFFIKRYVGKPLERMMGELNSVEKSFKKSKRMSGNFIQSSELGGIYNKFVSLYLRLDQKHKLNNVLLNAIGDIIITVDRQGLITYVNPPAQKWLGFDKKELLKHPLSLFLVNFEQTEMSATHWLYNALHKGQDFHQKCQLRRLSNVEKIERMEVMVRPLIGLDHVSSAMITLRHCAVT